ncbi:MAG: hypothetical protein ABEJ70_07665 [Halobacteriaceae archaeon]
MRTRLVTALLGTALSLAISAALWHWFGVPFAVLFVPFVPIFFWRSGGEDRPPVRECPACGFRTRDPAVQYCPRDGTALE